MEWIVGWVVLAIVVAFVAPIRGRSGFGWFLVALLLSPVIALLLLIVLPDLKGEIAERGRSRQCPFCAERVKREAIVCRHCGRDLAAAATMSAADRVDLVARRAVVAIGAIVLAAVAITMIFQ